MKRKFLLMVLFLCTAAISAAAQEGDVIGKVVTRVGRVPVQGARITLRTLPERTAVSDSEGSFSFTAVPYGVYNVTVDAVDYLLAETSVRVDVPLRDMNLITLTPDVVLNELDDTDMIDFDLEGSDGMSAPGLLSASRDPFDNVAGYKFSSMRFRTRGYDSGLQDVYMNGIRLNDALTGYSPWSLWSGLNDATRNQEVVSGLTTLSDFGVGGVNGMTNIDARASAIRQGWRASAVTADAQYRLRLMLSYSSGMLDNGWAYAFSVSTRQGRNEHIDGVYYNAWGYYFGLEKMIDDRHRLSFSFLGTPTKRGAQMATTDEMYWLMRYKQYNPNWGWQDGKRRNARVRDYHEPLAILNYEFDMNDRTKFTAGASFRFGKNGYSALDWFDAADPKPDYHGNLPSYYEFRGNINTADGLIYDFPRYGAIQQINWDRLYQTNYQSTETWNGPEGTTYPAGRSHYIVSDRRTDQRDFNLNLKVSHQIDDNSKITAGFNGRVNRTEYFTTVKDLLGGQYWLNVDNFAYRDYPNRSDFDKITNNLSDLGDPNRLMVYEGDKYGYDYYAHVRDFSLWGVYNYTQGFWQAYAAAEVGYNNFWREGLYRKGLFPNSSYGNSAKQDFFTYKAKVGATFRPSGMHTFSVNGIAQAEAPNFSNAFISPRTRNTAVDGLTTVKTYGADATYFFRAPWLTLKVAAYFTLIQDQTDLITFYDDTAAITEGGTTGAFTNFAMSGIDQRHYGLEVGFRVPLQFLDGLSVTGAVSLGDYTYVSNPLFTQTVDSSEDVIYKNEIVRYKNYKVESTPQTAANLGLNYRSPSYWYFGFDVNYFDRMYLSMNPMLRTDIVSGTVTDPEMLAQFRRQEKFDGAFILNANIGKSWYIKRNYQLGFSLELKNLLNSNDIRTGGFEQMRLRVPRTEDQNYNTFDSKYYYLTGFNYYLNVYLRF